MSARQSKAGTPGRSITWFVFRVGGPRGRQLGTVEAPDEEAALMAAFVEFEVEPADRKRIMVRPSA